VRRLALSEPTRAETAGVTCPGSKGVRDAGAVVNGAAMWEGGSVVGRQQRGSGQPEKGGGAMEEKATGTRVVWQPVHVTQAAAVNARVEARAVRGVAEGCKRSPRSSRQRVAGSGGGASYIGHPQQGGGGEQLQINPILCLVQLLNTPYPLRLAVAPPGRYLPRRAACLAIFPQHVGAKMPQV